MFFDNLSVKDATLGALKGLPDNCTFEDIIREIQSLAKMLEGYKDIERGFYITPEELAKRLGNDSDY